MCAFIHTRLCIIFRAQTEQSKRQKKEEKRLRKKKYRLDAVEESL